MVEHQRENIEIIKILGIQLKMKNNYFQEKAINQDQAQEENQSHMEPLSFYFQDLIEEEELLP
jgi:hypothetical protein